MHLIWLGSELPNKYYENVASWKTHNPDLPVVVYVNDEIARRIASEETMIACL